MKNREDTEIKARMRVQQRRQDVGEFAKAFTKINSLMNIYFFGTSIFLVLMVMATNLKATTTASFLSERFFIGIALLLLFVINALTALFYPLYKNFSRQNDSWFLTGILVASITAAITFFRIQPFNSLTVTSLITGVVFMITWIAQLWIISYFEDPNEVEKLDMWGNGGEYIKDKIHAFISGSIVGIATFVLTPLFLAIWLTT